MQQPTSGKHHRPAEGLVPELLFAVRGENDREQNEAIEAGPSENLQYPEGGHSELISLPHESYSSPKSRRSCRHSSSKTLHSPQKSSRSRTHTRTWSCSAL